MNIAYPASPTKNILTNYGEITLEQIRAFEASYTNNHGCAAQDAYALHRCIVNSISKDTQKRISV